MKVLIQYLLPQHLLSKFAALCADAKTPFLKDLFISLFLKAYPVNLQEAEISDPKQYKTFTDFFTRHLKKSARPINQDPNIIVSPADGTIAQIGSVNQGKLIQAKDHDFNLQDLLGGDKKLADTFEGGNFVTIYLAPQDYHRVHVPIDSKLIETYFIPGKLFSVNNKTTARISSLYSRNERLVTVFENETIGRFAVVFVGALIVGSIQLSFQNEPVRQPGVTRTAFNPAHQFKKAEELGCFKLGSTVIVVFEPNKVELTKGLLPESLIRLGEAIGQMK